MAYLRLLLLPFSVLYGLIIRCRNVFYDRGWFGFRQTAFELPVIVTGNLEVGGTGKTPMTEYLIRLLKDRFRVAVVSRGYGRRSRGYLEVTAGTPADRSGDEPLQFKRKFPDVTVAVSEKRVPAIERLCRTHDLILLDDAYQHRSLKPGFSILLFDYHQVLRYPLLLPAGNYRDSFSARHRADVMIVTKCPPALTLAEKQKIQQRLAVRGKHIPVLFAGIAYGIPERVWESNKGRTDPATDISGTAASEFSGLSGQQVLLVTGIARPRPFVAEIRRQAAGVRHLAYADHHRFSRKDLKEIRQNYEQLQGPHKIILTTEKDAMRLAGEGTGRGGDLLDLPLYYIPIRQFFHDTAAARTFDEMILHFSNSTGSPVKD